MVEALKVGDVTAHRGEVKLGFIKGIELNDETSVNIPIIIVNGAKDGPALLLISTQHGTEIQGIEVIRQVTRLKVDPEKLQGSIIAIPVANPLAFQHCSYTSWIDSGDVSGVRADNPKGTTTERLANAIWEQAYSKADYIINIHCNVNMNALAYESMSFNVLEIREKLEKMADAFGLTLIDFGEEWINLGEEATLTLDNMAIRNRIPVLLVELFDGRRISKHSVEVGVCGVLNVMKALGMIEGKAGIQKDIRVVPGRNRFYARLRANRGGIIHPEKEPGEKINKGDTIARIYNLHGDIVEEVKMPVDGYLWAYPFGKVLGTSGGLQVVNAGDMVAYVFVSEKV